MDSIVTALIAALGKNASVSLAEVIALFEGNPVSIPIQPLTEQVSGKTLVVSLEANALQLQLK